MPFEDWEGDHKIPKHWLIIAALIAVVAIAGTAYAVYNITSPPSDPVVATEPATLSKPAVNATAVVVGDTVQISTTLSDGLEARQVFFYENDVQLPGSSFTNSEGTAVYNREISAVGTYIYTAKCVHP